MFILIQCKLQEQVQAFFHMVVIKGGSRLHMQVMTPTIFGKKLVWMERKPLKHESALPPNDQTAPLANSVLQFMYHHW